MTRVNPDLETLPARPVPRPVHGRRVLVLGGGMVGVCTALELQARGADVTLVDRRSPGQETSYGNAGVFARSSLAPLNNPDLFADLPGLLSNRRSAFRYDMGFVLRNLGWAAQFLANARPGRFQETVAALDGLIRLSIAQHQRLMTECALNGHLSDRGWVFLYRSAEGFAKGARARDVMTARGVDAQVLAPGELTEMEPALKAIFAKALWIRDSYSVDNPGAVVAGYAKTFMARGGAVVQAEARDLQEDDTGATLHLTDGTSLAADHAVLCLGPWGRQFLERSGFRVRMAYERGYHRHFVGGGGNAALGRPVYDTGGGYVLAPMEQGLRLTTGVELCDIDAPANPRQIALAETAARQAVDLGDPVEVEPWLGSRPTFPDSRPTIGALPGARHLSVAFGHQHIGFMTGPGTASLLADLIEGQPPQIDAAPFSPARFIRRA